MVENVLNILDKLEGNLDNSLSLEREAERERETMFA